MLSAVMCGTLLPVRLTCAWYVNSGPGGSVVAVGGGSVVAVGAGAAVVEVGSVTSGAVVLDESSSLPEHAANTNAPTKPTAIVRRATSRPYAFGACLTHSDSPNGQAGSIWTSVSL